MGQGSVRRCVRVTGIRDPQGDFDDCEERQNTFRDRVSLVDNYLSDDPTQPRKWRFPAEAILEPGGYLLVWLNEDTADSPGLRANFKFNAEKTGKTEDELRLARADSNPAGRFGTIEEFGDACAYLCSAQAGYITGQNLLLDGGAYPGTFG